MSSPEDSFIPEGHAPFPSLYTDNGLVAEFSEWTDEALNNRVAQYQEFIKTSELPNHIKAARRIVEHAIWELTYREGFYE